MESGNELNAAIAIARILQSQDKEGRGLLPINILLAFGATSDEMKCILEQYRQLHPKQADEFDYLEFLGWVYKVPVQELRQKAKEIQCARPDSPPKGEGVSVPVQTLRMDGGHPKGQSLHGWRTSLADMYHIFQAAFCVASSPETGMDDGTHFGNQPGTCVAPVMRIFELLPSYLEQGVKFTNLVDFAGSSSSNFCNTRVRTESPDGKAVYCDKDFERKLQSVCPTQNEECLKETAIHHSMWIGYWRGKVSGGLSCSLGNMASITVPDGQKQLDGGGPFWSPAKKDKQLRVVVVITVDGGPASRVEKSLMPGLIDHTLSDLRRRKYKWSDETRLIWVQFPCVTDVVDSLNGVRNLAVDPDPWSHIDPHNHIQQKDRATFHLDDQNKPLVYHVVDSQVASMPSTKGLLNSPVESIWSDSMCSGIDFGGLMTACKSGDKDAVCFGLSKAPNLATETDKDGFTILIKACNWGCVSVASVLLANKANVNAVSKHGHTPLTCAVKYGYAELLDVLLDAGADVNQSMTPKDVKAFGRRASLGETLSPIEYLQTACDQWDTHEVDPWLDYKEHRDHQRKGYEDCLKMLRLKAFSP